MYLLKEQVGSYTQAELPLALGWYYHWKNGATTDPRCNNRTWLNNQERGHMKERDMISSAMQMHQQTKLEHWINSERGLQQRKDLAKVMELNHKWEGKRKKGGGISDASAAQCLVNCTAILSFSFSFYWHMITLTIDVSEMNAVIFCPNCNK